MRIARRSISRDRGRGRGRVRGRRRRGRRRGVDPMEGRMGRGRLRWGGSCIGIGSRSRRRGRVLLVEQRGVRRLLKLHPTTPRPSIDIPFPITPPPHSAPKSSPLPQIPQTPSASPLHTNRFTQRVHPRPLFAKKRFLQGVSFDSMGLA